MMGADLQDLVGCWELDFCPELGGILEGFPEQKGAGPDGAFTGALWRPWEEQPVLVEGGRGGILQFQEARVQTPDGGNCGGGTKWADSGWCRRWSWQVWV